MNLVRLGIAIQHAPWAEERRPMLTDLLDQLEHEYRAYQAAGNTLLGVTAWPVPVIKDRGTRKQPEGLWPVNRRCWKTALAWDHPTHVLVLQDDMLLCRNFFDRLAAAIIHAPEPERPICLLCARKKMKASLEKGQSYMGLPDGTWGGSTVLPVRFAHTYLSWVDSMVADSCPTDDQRLDLFLRQHDWLAWATVPSLIQHIGDRSLCGRGKGRETPFFADDFAALPSPLFAQHRPEELVVSSKSLHKSTFAHLKESA